MEYLMTYGWAILVVIIVGVVLWQMGIFNPSGGTAPGFSGFGSVRPKDWSCSVSNDETRIQYVNAAGESINVTATSGDCLDPTGTIVANGNTFKAGANSVFVCEYMHGQSDISDGCRGLNPGDRFESRVKLTWRSTDTVSITHTENGKVWKAAEA
jgi:hypothetical protein